MKLTHYIYICTALAMLTACHDDTPQLQPIYTVGEAINAISLRAGISQRESGAQTRADADVYVPFSAQTQLRLRIDGTWTGHTLSNISKNTTALTASSATIITDGTEPDTHVIEFNSSEKLYWDDYGTADPANSTGRAAGLTIYGVAVNASQTAPTVENWQNFGWTLTADQSSGWASKDLLLSNNIKAENDGTYKFDDFVHDITQTPKKSKNLLKFTHAMSKITINLIAGDGFPTEGIGATTNKFAAAPEVILTSNLYGQTSKTEWANTSYSVNVESGAIVTASTTPLAITTMTSKTDDPSITIVKDALVMPGSTFSNATDGVYPQVLSILADGNRYYVTTQKIRDAIQTAIDANKHKNEFSTQPGKNYIFKITVKKTGIDVTATIKDWENVVAANEAPKININHCYGGTGTDFARGFNFYRSTSLDGSFMEDGNKAEVGYSSSMYTITPSLYWPDHSTHYFFRGIWPIVGSQDGSSQKLGPVAEDFIDGKKIKVANEAYRVGYYPSDLMIGMPRKDDGSSDEFCKAGHLTDGNPTPGICATDAPAGSIHANEGLIHMNFQYAMSQVAVELLTSTGSDNVAFDANTTVEIIDGYTSGALNLADGSSDFTGKSLANYTMHTLESADYDSYRDAIIPQSLVDADGHSTLKFRITVGNGSAKDVYETVLGIANIKEQTTGNSITKWEPGKKYVYTLYITKTDIVVVATIKDWVEVKAEENIWF